jgi:hypothetical protein
VVVELVVMVIVDYLGVLEVVLEQQLVLEQEIHLL